MPTFRITVQKQRTDGLWPVYIRVTHNRKITYIKTTKMTMPENIMMTFTIPGMKEMPVPTNWPI